MEQNKDNKRWIMIAITTVMIILIGSLGVNYVVNQQQKDKENKKINKQKNIIYKDSIVKDIIRSSFWGLFLPVSPRLFANIIERKIIQDTDRNGKYTAFIPSKLKRERNL